MREEVTFYSDESKQQALFGFKARQVVDLGATYDVITVGGEPLGLFRKDAVRSLLSSTWHLEPAGAPPAQDSERSTLVALLRRVQNVIPLPYHFDFVRGSAPVFAIDRAWGIRDRVRRGPQFPGLLACPQPRHARTAGRQAWCRLMSRR